MMSLEKEERSPKENVNTKDGLWSMEIPLDL